MTKMVYIMNISDQKTVIYC